MDTTTPVEQARIARATLHKALGGVDESAKIVNAYEDACRTRREHVHKRERALFESVVSAEIPYIAEEAAKHAAALVSLHAIHVKACEEERVERAKATAALEGCAPWARDLPATRQLMRAHYQTYPRYQSTAPFLMNYIDTSDAIDLGSLVVELSEDCARDAPRACWGCSLPAENTGKTLLELLAESSRWKLSSGDVVGWIVPPEEVDGDVQIICEQTDAGEVLARQTLMECNGDVVEAVMRISS